MRHVGRKLGRPSDRLTTVKRSKILQPPHALESLTERGRRSRRRFLRRRRALAAGTVLALEATKNVTGRALNETVHRRHFADEAPHQLVKRLPSAGHDAAV